MLLLRLLNQEARGTRALLCGGIFLSGLMNTSILAIVQHQAHATDRSIAGIISFFGKFVVACAVYALSFRYWVSLLSKAFESVLNGLRLRLVGKLRRADLHQLEQTGAADIYESICRQITTISNSTWPIALGLQSLATIAFVALYVAYLSPLALGLALVLCLFGGSFYYLRGRAAKQILDQAAERRRGLFDLLMDLIKGHKELRFRSQRSEALCADVRQTAAATGQSALSIGQLDQRNYVFFHLNLFGLLAAIVFVLPNFLPSQHEFLGALAIWIIFLFSPLNTLQNALPEYERAEHATHGASELEHLLERSASPVVDSRGFAGTRQLRELRAEQLTFSYTGAVGEKPFSVGPLSLTIRAGEIVFLTGGNGSGKTTLLKLLISLYTPASGQLYVNDHPVDACNTQSYREMIAAVFTDCHLFRKMYGLSRASAEEVEKLLLEMRIAHRIKRSAGHFIPLPMSTGQRKRLAMVVGLLADRPLYAFDELAADQDPVFRQYFYEVLLQELKRNGKTVIAISHDDRYFHCADRVITLEKGQIREVRKPC